MLEAEPDAIKEFYATLRQAGTIVDEKEDTEQCFILRDAQPALVALDNIWRELIR